MQYESLIDELIGHADKERAVQMKCYMRDQFEFLGLPAKIRKNIVKPYMAEAKKEKEIDWEFVEVFWDEEYRECQYIVCDYLRLKQDLLKPEDISKLKSLILRKSWWDTIDAIDRPIAYVAENHPELKEVLIEWSTSESIWLRRISIIHQRLRKENTDLELLETVIVNNLNHDEFFINKGIGWALRAYSRSNAGWVRKFIEKYETGLSKLSIREGSKYL